MNILQRIAAVRASIDGYLQKDARITGPGGGYRALTFDKLIGVVRPHLVEHGVLVVPRFVESARVEGTTKSGGFVLRYSARYEVDFLNVEDPNDKLTMPVEVDANDSGDKAPPKGQTIAKRIALRSILDVQTGEDEEQRGEELARTAPDGSMIPDMESMRDVAEVLEGHLLGGDFSAAYEVWEELTQGQVMAMCAKPPTKGGLFGQDAWKMIKSGGEFATYKNEQRKAAA